MSIETESDVMRPLFQTELGTGRDGFLAHVIVKGLELGDRTPEDFIRHFPPKNIMLALAERPILRADILVAATGTKEKTALKKSAESAGEDLQIALDEGDTTCAEIVRLFQPDERVRYLDRAKLWAYATESKFWTKTSKDKDDFSRAQAHVAFILQAALDNLLVDHAQVVDALTVDRLAKDLPKELLGKIIQAAITLPSKFDEVQLLSHVTPETLVKHVSLAYTWETVVEPHIVKEHGFTEAPKSAKVASDPPEAAPDASAPASRPWSSESPSVEVSMESLAPKG